MFPLCLSTFDLESVLVFRTFLMRLFIIIVFLARHAMCAAADIMSSEFSEPEYDS